MTTITIVHKDNQIAIAADTQSTFGDDQQLLADYDAAPGKILRHGESLIAITGCPAHALVLKSVLKGVKNAYLMGRERIFKTFCRLHPKLKEDFFLQAGEDDDAPYESSQMMLLIANPSGIFGVYPSRTIHHFKRFWALGSGRKFAMGAMFACYEQALTAEEIAKRGVEAGAAFDVSTSLPLDVYTVEADKKK